MSLKFALVIVIVVVIVGIIVLSWFVLHGGESGENTPVAALAQCLAQKGATVYGAEWCPHCQNQKNMFGEAFKYISYVECPKNPAQCLAAGITGYPTWTFPSTNSGQVANGSRLEGEQELGKLAEASGCALFATGLTE